MRPGRGRLIALEGGDGTGKSTQAPRLADALGAVATFQFGATPLGAAIRSILLDPANDDIDDRAEALLVIADKAQHVAGVVRPHLEAGRDVVTDRYTASTLAYQGWGRGLDRDALAAAMDFATAGVRPDVTVLLDLDAVSARARWAGDPDRFEGEAGAFHDRVRSGYLHLAEDPSWVVVDAAGDVDEVAARILAAVRDRLVGP